MFRATVGTSSGETTVFVRHLVPVIVHGMHAVPCVPDSHPCKITSTKCRTNTVFSPDDGPTVARNM